METLVKPINKALEEAIQELKRVAALSQHLGGSVAIWVGSIKMIDSIDALIRGDDDSAINDLWASVALTYGTLHDGFAKLVHGLEGPEEAKKAINARDYKRAAVLYSAAIKDIATGTKYESAVRKFL